MNAKNVLTYAADQEARFVSIRFTDLIGSWHHLTYPIHHLTEDSFEDGFGFDASSLRGWAAINESDMLLVPDPSRFWVDPFAEETTTVAASLPYVFTLPDGFEIEAVAAPPLVALCPFRHVLGETADAGKKPVAGENEFPHSSTGRSRGAARSIRSPSLTRTLTIVPDSDPSPSFGSFTSIKCLSSK